MARPGRRQPLRPVTIKSSVNLIPSVTVVMNYYQLFVAGG